jgi:nitric oxide reductase NorD protein
MYKAIPADDEHAQDVIIETPLDDYELLDFGNGRKLERFGPYVLNRPDKRAQGVPLLEHWEADWVYHELASGASGWQPARADLPAEWDINLDGMRLRCVLGEQGRTGINVRDVACRRWIVERLSGCYDIDDLRMLNLFGGSGALTGAGLQAGAEVTHVDSAADMLERVQRSLGEKNIHCERAHVPTYVERAQMRGEHFHFIAVSPPRIGRAHGASWDIEVDLARLIRNLPNIVNEHCRGIWVHVDAGSWTPPSIGQMLREALPGRSVEILRLGIATRDGRVLPAGGVARWYDPRSDLLDYEGQAAFTASEIEDHLDVYLDAVLSSRRTAAAPARQIAALERGQQDFTLHWVSVVAHSNGEMAYQLANYTAEAFRFMDAAGVEAWIIHTMDVYDTAGLHAGISSFREAEKFAREQMERASGLAFEEVAGVIEVFIHGLNGRKLKVEAGESTYTDTETLFLPAMVSRFKTRDENFQLYKAIAVHLWAQCWYGTWRVDVGEFILRFANADKALALFHALEALRLDACIRRDLPGVSRQLAGLRAASVSSLPEAWEDHVARLQETTASVHDTCAAVTALYEKDLPEAVPYQGSLNPARVEQVRTLRLDKEKQQFRLGLMRMRNELQQALDREGQDEQPEDMTAEQEGSGFELREIKANDTPDGFSYEIVLDGKPQVPPADVKGVMSSILQDLGEIPEDYLVAAGEGAYSMAGTGAEQKPEDVWKGTYHEEGAFLYNEWDYERRHYRKNWAVLRELEVNPRHDDFVARTLEKYRGLAGSLRRTFEALRGEDKLLKKQPYGDNIDIDALVEAYAESKIGMEMSERLFTKMHKLERNIAVMFMVDMSGSTKGWINDAEREALVLLCESLETLGDRYAIYGFSGMTRKRCEVYRVKRFDEPYDDTVRARISGIKPQDYTRMGVTIRHLTSLLNQVEARTKLLITLSDGKPDDYDTYRGTYGIEDTRQALIEAKREGIHSFCITIDTEARDYLPHMYGAVNYAVIDEVRKLPLKVSDIYRRLTT